MRSVEVAKLLQRNPLRYLFQWKGQKSTLSPSFITFSAREPFWGGSCVGQFGLFGPKGALGSQRHVEEFSGVCEENCRFAKKLCVTYSFYLLLSAWLFSNPTTRWRSSTHVLCNTLLISPWTKVLKVVNWNINFLVNLDMYKIQYKH